MKTRRDALYWSAYWDIRTTYINKQYNQVIAQAEWFFENYHFPIMQVIAFWWMNAYLYLSDYNNALLVGNMLLKEYDAGRLGRQNHFALFSNLAVATLQTGKKGAYLALLDQAEACATNDQQKATVKEHREKFFQEHGKFQIVYSDTC